MLSTLRSRRYTFVLLAQIASPFGLVACATSDDGGSDLGGAGDPGAGNGGSGAGASLDGAAGVTRGSGGVVAQGGAGATSTSSQGQGGAANGSGGDAGAGGHAGTAGSGGQGDSGDIPAPHTVKPCPTAGSATVGVWEQSNPAGIQIPAPQGLFGASMMVMNPSDTSMVYVAYDHHGIYKSTDCGAAWTKANTGRSAALIDTGSSWTMAIDPVDPRILYANNGYGTAEGLFKSTNGGVDWDQTIGPDTEVAKVAAYNFVTRVSMDPTNHLHLVVAFHSGCSGAYAPNCLAETTDGAATWKPIKLTGSGSEAAGIALVDSKRWLFGGTGAGLWLTTDAGASWSQVAADGGYNYYLSKKGVYYMGAGSGVLSSTDLRTWTKNGGASAVTSIASDGDVIYGGKRYCFDGAACYVTSPETDGHTWTDLKANVSTQGGLALAYDPDHHILYSANETMGFWRVLLH
jgi:hypothetical protein